MLADDDGEERHACSGLRLSLQHPEAVLADIGVLRREGDEAASRRGGRRTGGRRDVDRGSARSFGRPSRPCWQTTTGRRSPACIPFGTEQNAEAKTSGQNIQHDLVAVIDWLVVVSCGERGFAGRLGGGKLPDHLAPRDSLDRRGSSPASSPGWRRRPSTRTRRRRNSPSRIRCWLYSTSWSNCAFLNGNCGTCVPRG